MTTTTTKHPLIAAWCFLALMGAATLVTTLTFFAARDKLFVPHTWHELLVGKAAAAFEDAYEDGLVVRDYAVHLWGAVKYAVFTTGNDGVVIGKDGWLFSDEEYKTIPDAAAQEADKLEKITKVREYLASHGVELVVALLPAKSRIYEELTLHQHPPHRVELYRQFHEALRTKGIVAPDLYNAFMQAKPDTQLFMRTDTHWTPEGAALTAHALAQAIQTQCAALALPAKAFTTTQGERQTHEGDLLRFIPTGVYRRWVGPQPETFTLRSTKANDTAQGDASALFGGEDIPVALVGTSYSQQEQWNFEGALKDALQADVVNTASEGKGPLDPMAKFLKETDFAQTTLKLVVWEIPERFLPVAYPDVTFPNLVMGDKTADACSADTGGQE